MEEAHHTLGGSAPGRRWRLQHLNDAYIVLLAAHFQSFCRNLHSEAVSVFAAATQPAAAQCRRIDSSIVETPPSRTFAATSLSLG
jgi:hypothetical protein